MTVIAAGVEAALAKGRRSRAWYDAMCLLPEDVDEAMAEGNMDRMESQFLDGGKGANPWSMMMNDS